MKVIFNELNHFFCLFSAGLELLRHAVPGRRCRTCQQGRRVQGNTTQTHTTVKTVFLVFKIISVVKKALDMF